MSRAMTAVVVVHTIERELEKLAAIVDVVSVQAATETSAKAVLQEVFDRLMHASVRLSSVRRDMEADAGIHEQPEPEA